MVTISLLLTLEAASRQDVTGLPSMRTVQARHWPSPQPYLVPVRCKSSRSTSRRERSGSVSTVLTLPLMLRLRVTSTIRLQKNEAANGVHIHPTIHGYHTSPFTSCL